MSNLIPMHLVTHEEYKVYLGEHGNPISSTEVKRRRPIKGNSFGPPIDYEPESTTVWSFPDRGNWATHKGNYRGNWSPYIPRNLILKYTQEGDTVLDQMCGSGTTLVECKLLKRNGIGIEINPQSAMITYANLLFDSNSDKYWTRVYIGDARDLNEIQADSIDLIATHPPYTNIIPYSRRTIDGDLSALSIPNYTVEMYTVAQEAFRVLKSGSYCAILIGDTRRHRHYIPISSMVMQLFLKAGFILKEDIIKLQWKMKGTRERWRGKSYDFYKIAHEHLFVFRKPDIAENRNIYKFSSSALLSFGIQDEREGGYKK